MDNQDYQSQRPGSCLEFPSLTALPNFTVPHEAALALILDLGDGTAVNPVDAISVGLLEHGGDLLAFLLRDVAHDDLELSLVPDRE